MHLSSLISLLGAATLAACQTTNGTVTGKMGDARQVKNNPVGEVWVATFNGSQGVKGTVTAVGATIGVNYTVDVTGLPTEKGPFSFHVHLKAVPESGSCADTGTHLDSFVRGTDPPCASASPQTCEVGDLSGKYGKVAGPTALKVFNDAYSALDKIMLGYIGDRAIVFHDASSARIACATLRKVAK
ncbi:superoxide dismutase [Lasiosphaeria hispida]|uniref:superoxide dismutase n=1 Tax=Lasiosphaeria hispida TaxID=260671 RepID=A0AAJ0HUX5_9PEZI|nr:superoxide dismutase [Lasiosphaeria hispida]